MTHTLHRTGTPIDQAADYTLMAMATKDANHKGSREKLVGILRICMKYNPINIGDTQQGDMYLLGSAEEVFKRMVDGAIAHAHFDSKENLISALKEIREADLGMSVIVTGLLGEVKDCCAKANLTPHTQAISLGIWGKTERLPDRKHLDLHTMCGHAMVPLTLIDSVIDKMKAQKLTVEQAAVELTKPCVCGVFNPTRAAELLRRFL
jgi:hypothetical protein